MEIRHHIFDDVGGVFVLVMAVDDRGVVVTLELVSVEQREEHVNQVDTHSGSAH